MQLLADDQFRNARLFKSYDDFEEMPIHSTVLIDKTGRVHWARHGGGPFTDYDFLAVAAGADERARGEGLAGAALVGAAAGSRQSGFSDQSVVGTSSETVGWMCTARLMSV